MKKILSFCMIAMFLIGSLAMLGCKDDPEPGPSGPVGPTPGNAALLISLTVNGEEFRQAQFGTPKETLAESLTMTQGGNLRIAALGDNKVIVPVFSEGATARFVVKPGTQTPTEDEFAPLVTAGYTLTHPCSLFSEITSKDGNTINYYKFTFNIGSNTNLAPGGLKFDSVKQEGLDQTGGASSNITGGSVGWNLLSDIIENYPDHKISAATADPDANVFAYQTDKTGQPVPAADDFKPLAEFNDGLAAAGKFKDGDVLWLKVVAPNGITTQYRRVKLNFPLSGEIPYGRPTTDAGGFPTGEFKGKISGGLEVFDPGLDWSFKAPGSNVAADYLFAVIKPAGESAAKEGVEGALGYTWASWDEDGLYLFMRVDDAEHVKHDATGNMYEFDSVEVFVNESGNPKLAYDNASSQYRLNPNLSTTTHGIGETAPPPTYPPETPAWALQGSRSGEPSNVTTFMARMNADINQNGNVSRYVKADGSTTTAKWTNDTEIKGYETYFQLPWRFYETYQVSNNGKIGLELQINASPTEGTRNWVMAWSNAGNSTNYRNPQYWGFATLSAKPASLNGGNLIFAARPPSITAHPLGSNYKASGTVAPLTATAVSIDGGTLEFEWFSATANNGTGVSLGSKQAGTPGTAVDGVTPYTSSYTPTSVTPDVLTNWYYVVVTNNKDGAVRELKSSYANIIVTDKDLIERITLNNAAVALFSFDMTGKTKADYTTLSVTYRMSATVLALSGRSRVYGNFKAEDFSTHASGIAGINYNKNGTSSHNNSYLLNNLYATNNMISMMLAAFNPVADTWFTVTYDITGADKLAEYVATNLPSAATGNTLILGVGVFTNAGGDAEALYIQDMKDVKITKSGGADPVMGNGYPVPTFAANFDSNAGLLARNWIIEGQ